MKQYLSPNKTHPSGATSLLVVTAIALVFIAMITGLTALSIRENRQALDTDLSKRAFAVAEASAQDAAQWVSEHPGEQYPNCDNTGASPTITNVNLLTHPTILTSDQGDTAITCRTVTISSTKPQMQIKQDETAQVATYLQGQSVSTIKLQWSRASSTTALDAATNPIYPSSTNWPGNTPAAIEVTVVSWPGTASVGNVPINPSPDGLSVKTSLVMPTNPPVDFAAQAASPLTAGTVGRCSSTPSADGYYCQAELNLTTIVGSPGTHSIVMFKPRYKGADVQAEFFPGNAGAMTVQMSRAVIDVTARVGSLYRRVVAEKAIGNNSFLSDVLYSNSSICKNLKVKEDFAIVSNNVCSNNDPNN